VLADNYYTYYWIGKVNGNVERYVNRMTEGEWNDEEWVEGECRQQFQSFTVFYNINTPTDLHFSKSVTYKELYEYSNGAIFEFCLSLDLNDENADSILGKVYQVLQFIDQSYFVATYEIVFSNSVMKFTCEEYKAMNGGADMLKYLAV